MFTESNAGGLRPRYSAKRNFHHAKFYCSAPEAQQVSLVGDFNQWDPNANPMIRQPDGQWLASLELNHGYHLYVFLVDGERVLDPKAAGRTKDAQNQPVSMLAVS